MENLSSYRNLKKVMSLNKLKSIFARRGISRINVGKPKSQKVPLLSMAISKEAKLNLRKIITDLKIDKYTEVLLSKRIVKFNEDVGVGPLAKSFPMRQKIQKITIYNYLQERPISTVPVPIVIFSHGGAIRNNTSLKSPFLPIIKQYSEKLGKHLILITFDHRGSNSHKAKQKYSLEDRVADIEIAVYMTLTTLLDEYKKDRILWNGDIIFIGNSMGGHVATIAASEFHPNSLILPQPAAYAEEAQKLPFGYKFTDAITKKNSWKTSLAFDALEEFLENGGKALVIGADEDQKIPIEIIKRYAKELTYSFTRYISKTHLKNDFIYVSGNHETIDLKEVKILKKSLLN